MRRSSRRAGCSTEKALDSLIFTIEAFNSPHDGGRATRVLLHLQHAFEMLLKAALVQTKDKRVFDSRGPAAGMRGSSAVCGLAAREQHHQAR